MRLHYFCASHWDEFPHEAPPDRPMVGEKSCCFCGAPAINRAKSGMVAHCPAGHLPPGKFHQIFERAADAAHDDAENKLKADSPLLGLAKEPGKPS